MVGFLDNVEPEEEEDRPGPARRRGVGAERLERAPREPSGARVAHRGR